MNNLENVVISGARQGIGKAVALKSGRCKIDVLHVYKTTNDEVTVSESFCAAF